MRSRRLKLSLLATYLIVAWTFMPAILAYTPFSVQAVYADTALSQTAGYDQTAIQATADNWTRQSPYSEGNNPVLKWSYNCGAEICGSPVIGSDGTIYFGAANGNIYAIDASGNKKWEYGCGSAIESSMAIGQNGIIYATSSNGTLYALNPSGSLAWSYPVGDAIIASPVLGPNGNIYIGAKNGDIIAIGQNGQKLWAYTTSGIDHAPAVDSKGYVYAGTRNGNLVVLDSLGLEKWSYSVSAALGSPVVADDGRVYVAANKYLYIFKDFINCGYYNIGNINDFTSPAVGQDGSILIYGDKLYKFTKNIDLDWNLTLEDSSPPVLGADGTIYLASKGSAGLSAISPEGKVLWQYNIGQANNSVTLGNDGTIYACNKSGFIYALDTIPLKVASSQPSQGARDVEPDKPIVITFNKDLKMGPNYPIVDLVDLRVNKIPATLEIDGKNFTITPNEKLQYNTTYTARIPADSFSDLLDHRMDKSYDITFTVKQAPGAQAEPQAVFYIGQKFYKASGQTVAMDVAPLITDGRTVIPVGFLAKALGVADEQIAWNSEKQTVTISKDNTTIILTVGSNVLTVNGSEQQMDTVPFLSLNGRVYLPAGFVAKALGYQVVWNELEKSVALYRPSQTV